MRRNFDSIVTHWLKTGFCALLVSTVAACGRVDTGEDGTAIFTESPAAFVERVQAEALEINKEAEAAYWVRATYITPDTAVLAAKAGERQLAFASGVVAQARQYVGVETDPQTRRILDRLLTSTTMPAPEDAGMQAELATLATEMEGMYGAGKSCDQSGICRNLGELEKIMESSRDYDQLLEAWLDWRSVAVPLRPMYRRFVELMNTGAREYGYADVGALWKSGYEMEVDAFERETERLWSQVEPLYEQLHCHVRAKLGEQYGDQLVPADGPIPAHLLGNMWSQTWGNIYPLVEPYPGVSEWDISAALVEQGYDEVRMTKLAESFFTSLGLPELPASFWTNSLLRKPADREVVCHASAWDMGNGTDPRIKQCVEPTAGQLGTLHHELGHIYYFLMYRDQLPFFRDGAHDGFHEAIGDTIELSMTQDYLRRQGLLEEVVTSPEATINQQMKMALDKIAFLPFGKLVDQWRWKVFSGEIAPENYNQGWWDLRTAYQGIAAPAPRSEADFDPGAKYHIPGNTPYTRYFLSFIMQFQFHQSLCETAGHEGPLHECSIYANSAAGERLGEAMSMGASQPWPETMAALTGQRTMDAAAILDYFAPLRGWLAEQNAGRQCGW